MCANEQQAMANRKPSQSWDNLRYFLAVARTGTLSAAAEQLGTEHTTVARHIHALEEELNSRLFHRSNSGYGLRVNLRRHSTATVLAVCPQQLKYLRTASIAGQCQNLTIDYNALLVELPVQPVARPSNWLRYRPGERLNQRLQARCYPSPPKRGKL
jgi:hypothetical protein